MQRVFLSSQNQVVSIRWLRNDAVSLSNPRRLKSRYLWTFHRSIYVPLVENARKIRIKSRRASWQDSQQHWRTTPSIIPHSIFWQPFSSPVPLETDEPGAECDEKPPEEEIDLFTSSRLSTMLPDQLEYADDHEAHTAFLKETAMILEQELGIDYVYGSKENDDLIANLASEPSSRQTMTGTSGTDVQKTAMKILRNFDPQNPPSTADPEELQIWLECAAQQEAVTRYQNIVRKARDRNAFDSLGLMQRHVVKWFENVRDAVEIWQKDYLLNTGEQKARKRFGPFLCALSPEKMSVIASHEAIIQLLIKSGKKIGKGVPLISVAASIGAAVETEVISQQRMKERFHDTHSPEKVVEAEEEDETEAKSAAENTAAAQWNFSSSHLKLFLAELQRIDPKMGKNKRSMKYAMQRAKSAMDHKDKWRKEDVLQIGVVLLSILVENAKLNINGTEVKAFRVEKQWTTKKRTISLVVLDDNLHRMFTEDELISWAASTTRYTPMIVPPKDWSGPRTGAYLWLEADLMRTHGSHIQRDALRRGNLNQVYDGLNILGKTAWKINKEILEIAQRCWENNIPIGNIPTQTDLEVPVEPLPPDRVSAEIYADKESEETKSVIAANKSYRESVKKRQRIIQKNMDLRSLRCSAVLQLNQAAKFKDFERIYFPYNLDFRGRAYPVPPHLSNVGSDLCRGMLIFAEAKPLGKRGLYWLKVHLANFAGKDKMSFEDRVRYVDDNMDQVRESVNDPLSEDALWKKLEDPFQGLATCYEIVRAVDSGDPENHMCALPVHMDGSCNGLQHYAALGRDTVGGKAVNLREGDSPEDVYVGVMHEVIRRVAQEAKRELPFDTHDADSLTSEQKKALKYNRAAKLVNGLIDRGVVKRTVMTSVYGVTYIGARQQIHEKIEEKLEANGHDLDEIQSELFIAGGYLATVTMEVMGDLFQGARDTKNWLAYCASLISNQGHPVAWESPIGVPVVQPYRLKKPRNVVTVMQTVTLADDHDDLPLDKAKHCTAFPPNFVHSLDSSHMLLTALEMDRRGLSFSAVHDSFWTHACDVDEMNEALRDCFVDLYSRPILANLRESWELRYPDIEFPELPVLGDLDLNEVKSATYFFQ